MRTILLALVFIAFATPALATDGVLEINQTCAVETGCFAGDTAGLPVTITMPGSYRLTSNLSAGANVDGIFLNTSRVTIDFNGFSLTGGTIGIGTGNGIAGGGVAGAFAGFATIKNGLIRGARALGVALGGARGVRIENMTFDFNSGGGIALGDGAQVLGSRFFDNGSTFTDDAVSVGNRSAVTDNVVNNSGGSGIVCNQSGCSISRNVVTGTNQPAIETWGASTITRNTVTANTSSGIWARGPSCTIADNNVSNNAGTGIWAPGADHSTITGNTVGSNTGVGIHAGRGTTIVGNTVFDSADDGIRTGSSSLVRGNTITDNVTYGLRMVGFDGGFRENVIDDNGIGTTQVGQDLGANVCNGSLTCP